MSALRTVTFCQCPKCEGRGSGYEGPDDGAILLLCRQCGGRGFLKVAPEHIQQDGVGVADGAARGVGSVVGWIVGALIGYAIVRGCAGG
jgi:hypothetical protein